MNEIVIIGAGPAGISVAVEAVNAGISADKILILEKAAEHSFTIKKCIVSRMRIIWIIFEGKIRSK